MNKLAKGFLFALAGVAGVLLLAILIINLYVESEGVQARLETAVSRELKMPVKLSRVSFSFWSGLKVDEVLVQGGEEPFLHAPQLSAKLEWGPLFARRLVVREVLLSSPKVVWAQTSKGKWRLPKLEKEKSTKAEKPSVKSAAKEEIIAKSEQGPSPVVDVIEPSPTPDLSPAVEPSPEKKERAAAKSKKFVEFRVTYSRIEDASFHFLDRDGKPVAMFEGVTVNIPSAGKDKVHGDATIRKLTLHNSVIIENITTPFVFENGQLSLPEVDARLAGGTVRGDYTLHPEEDGSPFALSVKFSDVDMNRLITEAGEADRVQKIDGKLRGDLKLEGKSSQQKSFKGSGHAKLEGGRMEQYPLFQMLGQTLQIEELTRLEMQQAEIDVRISNSRVYVERLIMESSNLGLDATGEVRFDGKLDLDAGLAINEKISRQIPRWLQSNFKPRDGSDRLRLPFSVGGTLDRPGTDLARSLMGEKLERQAGDLIQAFRSLTTGRKKKSDKKDSKKSKEERKEGKKDQPAPESETELDH